MSVSLLPAQVSVAEEAKELGRRWKQLSDEERAAWKQQCEAAAAADAAAAAQGGGGQQDATQHQHQQQGDGPAEDGQPQAPGSSAKVKKDGGAEAGLPLATVKRVILLDSDVARVSHDAAMVVARAAEMFVGLLAERCARQLATSKPRRTTIKVQAVVRRAASVGAWLLERPWRSPVVHHHRTLGRHQGTGPGARACPASRRARAAFSGQRAVVGGPKALCRLLAYD